MKIVVIGTSNSVKKNGWVKSFSGCRPFDEVINLSIGANCSIIGITRLLQEAPSIESADLLIFDFAVNDQNFFDLGALKVEQIEKYVSAALQHAAFLKKSVLLLILPNRRGIAETSEVVNLYRRIAKCRNIPVFDGFAFARSLNVFGFPLEVIWEDGAHFSDGSAQVMGILIAQCIDHMAGAGNVICNAFPSLFDYIPISTFTTHEHVKLLQNSLISMEFVTCRVGDSLTLQMNPGDLLHGLVVNAGYAGALLEMNNGEKRVIKNLYYQYSDEGAIRIAIKNFVEPIVENGNGIVLSIVGDEEIPTEIGMHESQPTGICKVDLIGFIVERFNKIEFDYDIKTAPAYTAPIFPFPAMNDLAVSLMDGVFRSFSLISRGTLNAIESKEALYFAPEIMRDIGFYFKRKKRYQDAHYFLEQACLMRTNSPLIQLHLSDTLLHIGRELESEELFKKIESADVTDAPLYFDLKMRLQLTP